MTDKEKNNDPLEDLFKNHTQKYDIEYDERDWQALEKRLDLADEKYAYNQRMRWAAAAAVLLFSLLGYFIYENYSTIQGLREQLAEEVTQGIEQETSDENANGQEIPSNNQPQTNEIITGDTENSSSPQSPATADPSVSSLADNREPLGISSGEQVTEIRYLSELPCPECLAVSAGMNDQSTITPGSGSFTMDNGIVMAATSVYGADAIKDKPIKSNRVKSSPISAGIVLGPDLSTTGSISNFQNPGYKIGLRVGMDLNSRFAISAGLIHSSVRYVARGGAYNPPEGYWYNGIVAQETFAECALIDIPISLKYDFLQFERSRLFTTAGVSSYIMLSEDYRFRYSSNDANLAQEWSDNTGTRHWFSNASFSVGYELDIHSAWNLQIEPFIKMPLREVGWANVKLYSVGSFVSLNYQLK